jgi:NADPH:quinone reductase-like Zn-dependent oxidoreductase
VRAYEVRETTGLAGLVLNEGRADPQPGFGQILVRIRAAALNYRDQGVLHGIYGYTKFPVIPLSDAAGEVITCGRGVTRFRPGDRVASAFFQKWIAGHIPSDASSNSLGGMLDGVLAEYALLSEWGAVGIPEHLSFVEAATLPCAGVTAWNALVECAHIKPGDAVAVLGTGGVACFAIAFAKLQGARVLVASSSDQKLDRAKALGADVLVNYRTRPDWDEAFRTHTDGEGADCVVELGGANTLEKSMNATRPGGTIVVIGSVAGQGAINPRIINRKALRLIGVHVGSSQMFTEMNRAIGAAGLRPIVDRVFAFDEAKAAYAYQHAGQHFGKIVVELA